MLIYILGSLQHKFYGHLVCLNRKFIGGGDSPPPRSLPWSETPCWVGLMSIAYDKTPSVTTSSPSDKPSSVTALSVTIQKEMNVSSAINFLSPASCERWLHSSSPLHGFLWDEEPKNCGSEMTACLLTRWTFPTLASRLQAVINPVGVAGANRLSTNWPKQINLFSIDYTRLLR